MPLPLGVPEKGNSLGTYADPYQRYLSTGDGRIDLLLGGGLPAHSSVLFQCPSSDERDIFLCQFMNTGLSAGEYVVYIATDKSPDSLLKLSAKYKWNLSASLGKNLFIVDCYTWTLGKELKESNGISQVPGPNALNDISISLSKIMERIPTNSQVRVVFNSASTLLMYNNHDVIFKFIQITGARLKSMNACTIFTIETNMHDSNVISTLNHILDLSFSLSNNNGWKLSPPGFSNLTVPIDISSKGVTLQ